MTCVVYAKTHMFKIKHISMCACVDDGFCTIGHLSQEIKCGVSHAILMCVEESNYRKEEKPYQREQKKKIEKCTWYSKINR